MANEYTSMEGYSTAPLNEPVFEHEKVMVDSAAFNNWLNVNYSKLNSQSMKGPREHLYYLLSSYVSELNKKDGVILPKEHDLVLDTLFSWTQKLGVLGTHIFYNKIKRPDAIAMPELVKIPPQFDISAVNDMFVVKAKSGAWSTKFPYYFMIGDLNEFKATNGMQTQILSVSTGAAKDTTNTGHSQSTLMLVYSPSSKTDEFKKYWQTQFGINNKIKPKPLGLETFESSYIYNEDIKLHKEITFLKSSQGSYLVAYVGMDGAYQTNKPHFLNFLSQVNLTQATTVDK